MDNRKGVIALHRWYLYKMIPESEVRIDWDFAVYHKIDMLYCYYCIQNNIPLNITMEKKMEAIQQQNNMYNRIAATITKKFNENDIPHVFLKGISLINSLYAVPWLRYFNDIDLLVPESSLSQVVSILTRCGYVFGSFNNGILDYASRSQILFQRLYTHEIFNMVRKESDNSASNIDINFRFSWNGISLKKPKRQFEEFSHYIIIDNGLPCFKRLMNLIHLCCHLYNEAIYFALDKDFTGGDPKEIRLDRVFDIAFLVESFSDSEVESLENIATQYNCCREILYALNIVDHVFQLNYRDSLTNISDDSIDIDAYYSNDKKVKKWPISLDERIFNLDLKKTIAKELFYTSC